MDVHRDPATFGPDDAAAALAAGAVVVVPTDTVYGIAASPRRPDAVARLYEAKGRPAHLNLPVILGDAGQLDRLGVVLTPAARRLADRWWPGPLTLVVGFADGDAHADADADADADGDGGRGRGRPAWLAGRDEVAVRVPDHDYLRAVAAAAGPLLVTSANGHGIPPAVVVDDAVASLHRPPDVVIDGGPLSTVASTLVNTTVDPPVVERVGAIAVADLEAVLGGPVRTASG